MTTLLHQARALALFLRLLTDASSHCKVALLRHQRQSSVQSWRLRATTAVSRREVCRITRVTLTAVKAPPRGLETCLKTGRRHVVSVSTSARTTLFK